VRAYMRWVVRYVRFHGTRHPATLGQSDVVRFLSSLAVESNVSASTQNQAMAALSFLYGAILGSPLEEIEPIARAKRPVRMPVVMSRDEVRRVIEAMEGTSRLVATLLYGSGLRLLECLQLRVKDVDCASHEIMIRGGKGDKDRITMLPHAAQASLRKHLDEMQRMHARDLPRGGAG
jgi:site-specific recombinase XerD